MAHIEDLLLFAIAQEGKPYVLGAEADKADPDPPKFDCSELVQWMSDRADVVPAMPDGAFWQYRHCAQAGKLIPVDEALTIRGALLFRVTKSPPTKFDDVPHVAISLGDGRTVEARGKAWGVGSWAAASRFQAAALIPGVDYSAGHGQLPPEEEMPPAPSVTVEDLDGNELTFVRGTTGTLYVVGDPGRNGGGWDDLGGKLTSGPSASVKKDGTVIVNVRGAQTDDGEWHTYQIRRDAKGKWGGWKSLGGNS